MFLNRDVLFQTAMYSQMLLSDQIFDHISKSTCNLSFSFCKAKGTRLGHMMRVTSAPTRSRDRHLTFPLPRPRRRRRKSREKSPYYQNFVRLPGSYSGGKVWLGGDVLASLLFTFMAQAEAFGDCQSLSNPV